MVGFELGANNFSCVFAVRRKNSPVDCFAGGSREASPFIRIKVLYFGLVDDIILLLIILVGGYRYENF